MDPVEPTPQEIQELRQQLLKKVEEDGSSIPGGIHSADLARIKNGDEWLRRFLLHNDRDIKESLTMAWDTCKWRKTFGTNDISEQNVRVDFLEDGSMFSHSRDKDGKSLFILKCKKHVKGQRDLDELKRCLVYWFERLERQDKGEMITLFFDMSETGLSNMDMEYTKYLISLFKQYYPYFLNYILIFEMPWVLNAAFKIIKSWLPEKAVKRINFVNKSTLKNFVDPDKALTCWGGQDSYDFVFVPEDRNGKTERKVHFADTQSDSSPTKENEHGLKIKVSPSDYLHFSTEDCELCGSLSLTNADEKVISYKIKTTSPEKYRVKPSLGILQPGGSVNVNVLVHAGFHSSTLAKDKFLIMGMPVDSPDKSQQELTDLWKQRGNTAIEINRLRCSTSNAGGDGNTSNGSVGNLSNSPVDNLAAITKNVSRLVESNTKMESQLRSARLVQDILMIGVGLCLIALAYMVLLLRGLIDEGKSCPAPHFADV